MEREGREASSAEVNAAVVHAINVARARGIDAKKAVSDLHSAVEKVELTSWAADAYLTEAKDAEAKDAETKDAKAKTAAGAIELATASVETAEGLVRSAEASIDKATHSVKQAQLATRAAEAKLVD